MRRLQALQVRARLRQAHGCGRRACATLEERSHRRGGVPVQVCECSNLVRRPLAASVDGGIWARR